MTEDLAVSGRRRRRRILLALLLVLAAAYQVRYSWLAVQALLHPEAFASVPFSVGTAAPRVRDLQHEAFAAGLRRDDLVLAVEGAAYRGIGTLARAVRAAGPGGRVAIEVERGPGRRTLVLPLGPVEAGLGAAQPVVVLSVGVVIPWLCLVLGFLVAFARPLDRRAWLLLLLMLSFSQVTGLEQGDPSAWPEPLGGLGFAYKSGMAICWPLAMLLLVVAFPERLELDRRRPWLKWLLGGPLLAITVAGGVQGGLAVDHRALAEPIARGFGVIAPAVPVLFFGTIGLFFAVLGYRAGTARNPDARRRLRLLLWGSMAALTPLGLTLGLSIALRVPFGTLPVPIVFVAIVALALFPLTLAYVIVVEQAMDVRVVVRQGVQYALARNGVLVLQVLVSAGVLLGALSLAADAAANRPQRIALMAAVLASVFVLGRVADGLRTFVDRRFFRQAYDAEHLLTHVVDDLRGVHDPDALLALVTRRLSETLQVESVAALVLRGGRFVPAAGAGFDRLPEAELGERSAVVDRLRVTQKPLRLGWGEDSWLRRVAPAGEQDAVAALRCELLVPLAAADEVLGLLSLGPRRSGEPYAPSDLRLLGTVAAQAAVALQNAQLTAAIASEVARRERLSREIEIAREVQEGLFPQELPRLAAVELGGLCRPARGVGGDYYDYVPLPGGMLGIAVGDVSGKGIPAALLMSGLRAALRTQTTFGTADVATLMERLNQLIYDSSPPNRYVTFFYGQYDPASRVLTYVNAGHLPPMLFRPGRREPVRLEVGGPVIGLLPVATYEAGTVELRPGDLLVAYSDGVSEAMNGSEEEYGEDRLREAVLACAREEPPALVQRVLQSVDAFVGTARQHDDITLLAMRAS